MKREPSSKQKRAAKKSGDTLLDFWARARKQDAPPATPGDMMKGSELPPPVPKPSPSQKAPEPRDDLPQPPKQFHDRDYQTDCVNRVFEEWQTNRSTLVVAATGTGKTVISTRICERVLRGELGRGGFLFLAHKTELIQQAAETFRGAFPCKLVEIEKASEYASRRADIVVACVPSISRPGRLQAFAPDRFAAGCVDEAHHAARTNASYRSVMDYFTRKWFGVTATPDRSDEAALGEMFDTVAFQYDIIDAVKEGWLVPVGQRLERCVDLDYSDVRLDKDGEFNEDDINKIMRRDKMLYALADAAIKYSNHTLPGSSLPGKRPTLVFCASREHAVEVADILNAKHSKNSTGRAACVHYKLDAQVRSEIIAEYKRRNIRYLTNYGILGEGFDDDATCVIVNGRPIKKNRALFAQIVGRSTRPLDSIRPALSQAKDAAERRAIIRASGKPGAMVVDLCGVNHKLVLTMTDILGGRHSDEAMRIVKERVAGSDKVVDVEAELERVERQLAQQAAELAAREKNRRLREQVNVQTTLVGKTVDPFNVLDAVSGREPGWFAGKLATPGQVALLTKFGLDAKELEGITRHKASVLIETCLQRRRIGLATYKQARMLRKFGYDGNITFEQGARLLDSIKANGWKRPEL